MREYIVERSQNPIQRIRFANIEVEQIEPVPEDINLSAVFRTIEKNFPPHYFHKLKGVRIEHLDEFDERSVNAVYKDGVFHISNRLKDTRDLMDDVIHEFAHHMENLFPKKIYADKSLIREFIKKRHELKFELQSEGYWVKDYDFDNLKYDSKFDNFLYKRVGKNMLRMATSSIFIRPYAAVSIREYFATGFEAYYLGKGETLEKISPVLYDKIFELHNYNDY